MGAQSLPLATSGADNAAFGFCSGKALTSGGQNTVLGTYSGFGLTTGTQNTFVGYNSGTGATTGIGNVALGMATGTGIGTGCNNVVIGNSIAVPSTNGSCQLAIGYGSTSYWLTGCSTGAIRPGAGIMDCTGSTGTVGQVLTSNGSNAVCWGAIPSATPTVFGSVLGCTTSNTSLGACALLNSASTATASVAIGNRAMCAHTSGTFNVAVGQQSLECLTTGCYNTVLGSGAGQNLTSGIRNVAIGGSVQLPSTTGSCQLAIGFSSTQNWLTGCSDQAIRPGAGIMDCAGSTGTVGQALTSTGTNAVQWNSVPICYCQCIPNLPPTGSGCWATTLPGFTTGLGKTGNLKLAITGSSGAGGFGETETYIWIQCTNTCVSVSPASSGGGSAVCAVVMTPNGAGGTYCVCVFSGRLGVTNMTGKLIYSFDP